MPVQKHLKNVFFTVTIFMGTLFFSTCTNAQPNRGNDTTYYIFFPESITGRFYFSQKNTSFFIKSKSAKDLRYIPNTTLNMGVGATYHNFSLNLAYGFGFLNQDESKGKTKYLDLQGHFYMPKWATDCYGQFYRGYHLEPKVFTTPAGKDFYYRPDVKVAFMGLSQYRIFNADRYSYRAALTQNEWQKKSAGTLLAGAEIYFGNIKADSSFVPASVGNNYTQNGISKLNYFGIGPGVGYAYTLVGFQRLFVTASLTGNLNFSYLTEYSVSNQHSRFTINPVVRWRVAAGYNSRQWNLSANWIADYVPLTGKNGDNNYAASTGNYRIILAKRFESGEKLRKVLEPVAAVFKE